MAIRRVTLLAAMLAATQLWGVSALKQAEELILDNKLREASVLLEQAVRQEPGNERVYLYLGVIYEQLGDSPRAIETMRRGLAVATDALPQLYFNIANNYFKLGEYTLAQQMYTRAIGEDSGLSGAYLNRANARLKNQELPEALGDYVVYLRLDPTSSQRPQIEQIIAIIKDMLAQQEHERQEEERQRQQALAKQKALMDDVLNALRNASADAQNVGVGSGEVKVDFEASDIED